MKIKTHDEADVNITALIDCLMQCIIFFIVILSAEYIYGVAIKFPAAGGKGSAANKAEKSIVVYIQSDYLDRAADGSHKILQDGILKLNGKEIALVTSVNEPQKWEAERERGFKYLQVAMQDMLDKGYKKDMLMIQGDMRTYHWKVMKAIDAGKEVKIEAFSLLPPSI
jgi:biopolymer transport protein ExbD